MGSDDSVGSGVVEKTNAFVAIVIITQCIVLGLETDPTQIVHKVVIVANADVVVVVADIVGVKMGYILASELAQFRPHDVLPLLQLYYQQTLTACLVSLCLTARHCPPLPLCQCHLDHLPLLANATSVCHLDTCHPMSCIAFDISPITLFGSMSYHRRYTLLCIE